MTAGTADAGRGQRPNAGRNPQRYRARRAQYRAERVDLRSPLYMPEIANRQNNRRSESAATVEWSHCVMAYRVALMAVTGQAERFGSAGLA